MKKPFKRLYTEANRQNPLPDGLAEKTVGAIKMEAASSPESAAGPARRKRPSRIGRIAVPAVVTAAALCLAFLLFPGPAGLPAGNLSSDASGSGGRPASARRPRPPPLPEPPLPPGQSADREPKP